MGREFTDRRYVPSILRQSNVLRRFRWLCTEYLRVPTGRGNLFVSRRCDHKKPGMPTIGLYMGSEEPEDADDDEELLLCLRDDYFEECFEGPDEDEEAIMRDMSRFALHSASRRHLHGCRRASMCLPRPQRAC